MSEVDAHTFTVMVLYSELATRLSMRCRSRSLEDYDYYVIEDVSALDVINNIGMHISEEIKRYILRTIDRKARSFDRRPFESDAITRIVRNVVSIMWNPIHLQLAIDAGIPEVIYSLIDNVQHPATHDDYGRPTDVISTSPEVLDAAREAILRVLDEA